MRHQRRTFRTLVDLFSRRFFENDLLAPDIDLRPSAIWLMVRSVLAHLVAATAASLAMAGIVTALLVAATSLLSGQRLRIATVAVQAVVLGALTALLLGLQWTPSLGPAARAGDGEALAWLTAWPPPWSGGFGSATS